MSRFTVISFYTPDFHCFASDIIADCKKFNYSFDIRQVDYSDTLVDVWDRKVEFIGECIERYGSVLWLDVECRIINPIPEDWAAPLTSTFPMGKSNPVSTGLLWLNGDHLPLVQVWARHARKYPDLPDDFVLEFLLSEFDLPFTYIETEFFDRLKNSQIVRGQWQCEGLIIQHPTINRWPSPTKYHLAFNGEDLSSDSNPVMRIARKRKALYWRNFGGDFDEVDLIMRSESGKDHEINDWVFQPVSQHYAPKQYWDSDPEIFGVKPLSMKKFQDRNIVGFEENSFRARMLKKMKLTKDEKSIYPNKKRRFIDLLTAARNLFIAGKS